MFPLKLKARQPVVKLGCRPGLPGIGRVALLARLSETPSVLIRMARDATPRSQTFGLHRPVPTRVAVTAGACDSPVLTGERERSPIVGESRRRFPSHLVMAGCAGLFELALMDVGMTCVAGGAACTLHLHSLWQSHRAMASETGHRTVCPEKGKCSTFMGESPGWLPAILIVAFRTELPELCPVNIRMTVGAARTESEERAFANREKTFRDGRIPHVSGGMACAARKGRVPTSEGITCATVVERRSVNADCRKIPSVVLFVALDAAPIGKGSV